MVVGWDQKRPRKEDYTTFMRTLRKELSRIDYASTFMFGSYNRGTPVWGESDIDSLWVFQDHGTIDKQRLREASNAVKQALETAPRMRPLYQLTVTDALTANDGRLFSYPPSFTPFIQEAEHLSGPDVRDQITYLNQMPGDQNSLAHNLKKIRRNLLFAEFDKAHNPKHFAKALDSARNAVASAPKNLLYIITGSFPEEKYRQGPLLEEHFPDVDQEPLLQARWARNNLDAYDRMRKQDPEQAHQMQESFVSFVGSLAESYTRNH